MTDAVAEPILEEGACSNPECAYGDDGVCVARGDVHECEFFEPIAVEDVVEEPEATTIALPSGEALGPQELERVLAANPANTVVMLGLAEAGKTTLLCLLFDQLRTRRVPSWAFTRSKTIIGFVRRSYDSSVRSGRTEGTTPRTSRLESGASLHVACRDGDGRDHDLLLVDLSGEHVAELADGTVVDVVAAALARADHVPIIVDGRHIADPGRRAATIYGARALLGAVDLQSLPDEVSVSVVVTKGDLLTGVDMDAVFDEITRGTRAEGAVCVVTADRESQTREDEAEPDIERGHGVSDLLAHLTNAPDRGRGVWPGSPTPPAPVQLSRLWRTS